MFSERNYSAFKYPTQCPLSARMPPIPEFVTLIFRRDCIVRDRFFLSSMKQARACLVAAR